MTRRLTFAANWKMHLGPGQASDYMAHFLPAAPPRDGRALLFFPPAASMLTVAAAVQGVGLAFRAEELLRPLIDQGKLVPLLEEWCGTFPGWHLCYPKQRYVSPSVRAFVDFVGHSAGSRVGQR